MSEPEDDFSPFDEEKNNRLVWIVPSVLLHVIILIIWMTLPEEHPRKPSQRKLIINSAQAEQLQQHVEDVNLTRLHAKVSELQAIKQAMAKIRDNKMDHLRSFEEEMVATAPTDATGLFQQFMNAQMLIILNYESLLLTVSASDTLTQPTKALIEKEALAAAMPALLDLDQLQADAQKSLVIIDDQFAVSFALVNTGETQVDWILAENISRELSDLKSAMEKALAAKKWVSHTINSAYGRNHGSALDRLTQDPEYSIGNLKEYNQSLVDGQIELEQRKTKLSGEIVVNESTITDVTAEIKAMNSEIKALGNAEENEQAKRRLMSKVKNLQGHLTVEKRTLSNRKTKLKRLNFRPDAHLVNKVKVIKTHMGRLFNSQPDTKLITEALKAQRKVTQASKVLLETLAQASERQAEEGS